MVSRLLSTVRARMVADHRRRQGPQTRVQVRGLLPRHEFRERRGARANAEDHHPASGGGVTYASATRPTPSAGARDDLICAAKIDVLPRSDPDKDSFSTHVDPANVKRQLCARFRFDEVHSCSIPTQALARALRAVFRRSDDRARHPIVTSPCLRSAKTCIHETSLVWVVNAYMLTSRLPAVGRPTGDLFGSRKLFLLVWFFTAGVGGCGLANSQGMLILARAIQVWARGGHAVALSIIMSLSRTSGTRQGHGNLLLRMLGGWQRRRVVRPACSPPRSTALALPVTCHRVARVSDQREVCCPRMRRRPAP